MANKRLSKTQRRLLEVIERGYFGEVIHRKTRGWVNRNNLAMNTSLMDRAKDYPPGALKPCLTVAGILALEEDRQLAPIVQCQMCGNYRDMGGDWEDYGDCWAWYCNGVDEEHCDNWYLGSLYPRWIYDE